MSWHVFIGKLRNDPWSPFISDQRDCLSVQDDLHISYKGVCSPPMSPEKSKSEGAAEGGEPGK